MDAVSPARWRRRRGRAALPSELLRRDRLYHVHYDAAFVAGLAVVLATWALAGPPHWVTEWHGSLWAVVPLACYTHVLCTVFVHNAAHANFPRLINRVVGELCGLVLVTRFMAWELNHRRHHIHADVPGKDPHPTQPSFLRFSVALAVEAQRHLHQSFFELHGDTPDNRRLERRRSYLGIVANLLVVAFWYQLLGPVGFLAFFLPASVVGYLGTLHFVWSGHDPHNASGEHSPIDQDHGLYWIGNRLLFGIYKHATHHRFPRVFNPMSAPQPQEPS